MQTLRAMSREPLLHFIVLGGLIFALDRLVSSRQSDPRVIVVGADVEKEARTIFLKAQGREPSAAELKTLRMRWIDNEVLYREGLALRLEQGDPTLRERVIFKALNVIETNLHVPPIDDAGLREWFEQHRAQYDIPPRFDFEEAVVSGDASAAAAQRFAAALNTGEQLDVQSGLRVFKNRPRSNVVDSFGSDFAARLDALQVATWQVLPSEAGARVIRLEARSAPEPANFDDDELRRRVRLDWQDAKAQQLRTAAVRELGKKYTVQYAGSKS
jgi:hypothetical protein